MNQIACTVAAGTLIFAVSCASNSGVANKTETEKQSKAVLSENNVSTNAIKMEIIDWQDRGIGAKVNPQWLKKLVKGNPSLFLEEYDLTNQYANHKWFSYAVQNESLDVAETIARSEILAAVAEEMSVSINASMGVQLNDSQKDAVKKICAEVKDVKLSGVGFRTSYWQLQVSTDDYGNKRRAYNYYAFYSCARNTYNSLMNTYLEVLLKSGELEKEAKQAIAKNAQNILTDTAEEGSAKVEAARETELKSEVVRSEKQTEEDGSTTMSPALAALVATF